MMEPRDIKFLEEYKALINEFLDELKNMGYLKRRFSTEQSQRLKKLGNTAKCSFPIS